MGTCHSSGDGIGVEDDTASIMRKDGWSGDANGLATSDGMLKTLLVAFTKEDFVRLSPPCPGTVHFLKEVWNKWLHSSLVC